MMFGLLSARHSGGAELVWRVAPAVIRSTVYRVLEGRPLPPVVPSGPCGNVESGGGGDWEGGEVLNALFTGLRYCKISV